MLHIVNSTRVTQDRHRASSDWAKWREARHRRLQSDGDSTKAAPVLAKACGTSLAAHLACPLKTLDSGNVGGTGSRLNCLNLKDNRQGQSSYGLEEFGR
jgi:hypothetical protein